MSVQATAINEGQGKPVFTEVNAPTLKEAQERAVRTATRLATVRGETAIGIAYDLGSSRRVRLIDGTELDWDEFLAEKGLKDEGVKRYSARVEFTTGEALFHTETDPDRARIEALQKAKLTGREPEAVIWEDEDSRTWAMTWPDQKIMTEAEYAAQGKD